MLRGARLAEVFPPEVLEDFEPLLRRADRMGMTTSQMEMQLPRGSLNVAVTVATLRHQGERSGYVVVFEDLSDLLKAQKQAAWREVARRVAHEIKNPLTPIALSAERIQRHLERATPADPASSGGRAFLRGNHRRRGRNRAPVWWTSFPRWRAFPRRQAAARRHQRNHRKRACHVQRPAGRHQSAQIAGSGPAQGDGGREAIKRAIANLVDNAAEAMQDSMVREIEISTALVASRDAVEITVADTGHGVTRELKERLFLPYFSTKKRGTGLGLAIVSRIIEDHHGSIRVEENHPVGARFIIELPVVPEPALR